MTGTLREHSPTTRLVELEWPVKTIQAEYKADIGYLTQGYGKVRCEASLGVHYFGMFCCQCRGILDKNSCELPTAAPLVSSGKKEFLNIALESQ